MTSKVPSKADSGWNLPGTEVSRAPNLTKWSLENGTVPKNQQDSVDANQGEYLAEYYACLVGTPDVQLENIEKLRLFIQQGRDLGA